MPNRAAREAARACTGAGRPGRGAGGGAAPAGGGAPSDAPSSFPGAPFRALRPTLHKVSVLRLGAPCSVWALRSGPGALRPTLHPFRSRGAPRGAPLPGAGRGGNSPPGTAPPDPVDRVPDPEDRVHRTDLSEEDGSLRGRTEQLLHREYGESVAGAGSASARIARLFMIRASTARSWIIPFCFARTAWSSIATT